MSSSVDLSKKFKEILQMQDETQSVQFTKYRHLAISPAEESLDTLARLLCKFDEHCIALFIKPGKQGSADILFVATNKSRPSEWCHEALKEFMIEFNIFNLSKGTQIPFFKIIIENIFWRIGKLFDKDDNFSKFLSNKAFSSYKSMFEKLNSNTESRQQWMKLRELVFKVKEEIILNNLKRSVISFIEGFLDCFSLFNFIFEFKKKNGNLNQISFQFSGWKQIYQILQSGSYQSLILPVQECRKPCCLKCNSCLSSLKKFRETKEWTAPIKCDAPKCELKPCSKCNPCRSEHLHAEMKILQFFASSKVDYGYIGISKLCCSSCWLQLQAVNCLRPFNLFFRVSGTHAKSYNNWIIPDLAREQLSFLLEYQMESESSSLYLVEQRQTILINNYFTTE
jgi:OTT_1508-like deaminase